MVTLRRSLAAGAALTSALLVGCSENNALVRPSVPETIPAVRAGEATHRPIADKSKPYIYVADDYSNTVFIFSVKGGYVSQVGSITQGLAGPQGIAIDKAGTLYVPNTNAANVTVYPAGQMSPSLTLSQDLTVPDFVAVDRSGNVWVSNAEVPGSVVEFPKGSTTPSTVLTTEINGPEGLAFDAKGNLLVVNAGLGSVAVFPPGATSPSSTFGYGQFSYPLGIAVDKRGLVYVCDFAQANVVVFSSKHKFKKTIFTNLDSGPIAFRDKLFYVGGSDLSTVLDFHANGKPGVIRIHNNLLSAFGVAADPPTLP
ncbi:MAG TPA: NHL repeat-containing protein [Candidatus Cybelea sp.]|jgi:serine/threonine-protein kinase